MDRIKKVCRIIGSSGLLFFVFFIGELRANELSQESEAGADLLANEALSLDEAGALLAKTDTLESAYVGFVLSRSQYLDLLIQLVESPDASARLERLFEEGSLAGKMYALIGLQLLDDSASYSRLYKRAAAFNSDLIRTYDGCVMNKIPAEEALQRIQAGEYRQSFQDAWQGSSQDPQ